MGEAVVASDGAWLSSAVEAILLSTDRPLSDEALAAAISGVELGAGTTAAAVASAVEALNAAYDATGRAFRVERVAGGYRVMTRPEHAGLLASFHRSRASSQLTRAAVETLAVVAYQQPITRGRLEAIRGVGCGEVLRTLLDRRLVSVVGRAEEVGRPMLYGTTKRFLDVFGIASLRDLPRPSGGEPEPAAGGGRSGVA